VVAGGDLQRKEGPEKSRRIYCRKINV